jgi:hypothetical protein
VLGEPRVTFRPIDYPRRGDLLSRLRCWLRAGEIVREETAGLPRDRWLVVDPESRITQLGLLPLAEPAQTRFFASRTIGGIGDDRLAVLAGRWAQALTGRPTPPLPHVWLTDDALAWARSLRARVGAHVPRWAVVNLGVGGNERKRVGPLFERALVGGLLDAGFGVLLARGTAESEVAGIAALAGDLAAAGRDVAHLPPDAALDLLATPGRRALVTWQAPVERMAALVAAADLHVGYDSAGQHVAAAVGTPGVTAFVPSGSERHFKRWSAFGSGAVRVIRIEPDQPDTADAATAIVAAARELAGG